MVSYSHTEKDVQWKKQFLVRAVGSLNGLVLAQLEDMPHFSSLRVVMLNHDFAKKTQNIENWMQQVGETAHAICGYHLRSWYFRVAKELGCWKLKGGSREAWGL